MKVSDFIYRYPTNGWLTKHGICRVRVFVNFADRTCYAVLTTLDENHGTSVTNMIEDIADMLIEAQKIPAEATLIEHETSGNWQSVDRFDLISLDADGRPSWQAMSKAKTLLLLDCGEAEFDDYHKDARVMAEIHDATDGIPPIEKYILSEEPWVTERRLEIELKGHSREAVHKFIGTNPSEAKLAAFIKEDMSLIAENYAVSEDEYICFAELPVGDGRVDFAVFSGRSRMNVFLIEIKGANKPLLKKNHYGSFRAAVQEGCDQLVRRAEWCGTHYEDFRRYVHRLREEVIAGNRPYHAFLGPRYRLEVDPHKDVNIIYVLIAGRTTDDRADSHKRHLTEKASGLDLRIETWNSWANKLTRK